MKHIKLFCFLILVSLPLHSEQNQDIENYFLKIYENEKLEFLGCIEKEGLPLEEQLNTKCKISEIVKDAAYYLTGERRLSPHDFLDQFTRFKRINNVVPGYPRRAQERGTEGFVIIEYNISVDGDTLDPKIIRSECGDRRSPFTIYKTCGVFNKKSLQQVKNLRYEPARFEGKKISSNNVKHSFTFMMEQENLSIRQRKSRAFNKAEKAITEKDFEKAISIADANLESDHMFMSILASANYEQGNYLGAKEWSNKLKDELLKEGRKIPESMIIKIYIILISSLFNLGDYEEIINLEGEFSTYSRERLIYKSMLAMTNFYYGISYINTGNIHKGAYYLGFAAKNSNSKAESDYIDSVINQISSYL